MKKVYKSIIPALLGILTFTSCTLDNQGGLRYPTAEADAGCSPEFFQEENNPTDKPEPHATVGLDSIFDSDTPIGTIVQILADNHGMDSIRYPEEPSHSLQHKRRISWIPYSDTTLRRLLVEITRVPV